MSTTFHAPAARVAWFSDLLVRHVDRDRPLRILDVGCGTGDQILDLATRLARAQFVGVDIEPANIDVARARCRALPDAGRLTFRAIDYLDARFDAPFDLVISYSVLQFVPGGSRGLAIRIANDTAPGGLFANVMPYRTTYNTGLSAVRRLLRAARTRATDAVLMKLARLLHRESLNDDLLAERIAYAYAVPRQFDDDLAAELESLGFTTIHRQPAAHASPAQMKHALRLMKRPV